MAFSEDTPHPRPPFWFQQMRPEVTALCKKIIQAVAEDKRHILIKAEVKSGKKDIVECCSKLVNAPIIYATALNRKDVKKQKDELEMYDIVTRLINKDDECVATIEDIKRRIQQTPVWICLDECDYGSGVLQKMAPLFREFKNEPKVIKVYFSATSHETEVSALKDRPDFVMFTFVPPTTYHGAQYFLDANLVFEPDAFFVVDDDGNIEFTAHAETVIQSSISADTQRHIGTVRIRNNIPIKDLKKKRIKEALEAQLNQFVGNGRPWEIVPVDASDSHDWEDRRTRNGFVRDTQFNYLIVIKQTCTRGTDLKGWHETLAFWHDDRKHDDNFLPNTIIQALLRVAHYGEPQKIRIYGSKQVVELAANDNMTTYLSLNGKPPARTKKCVPLNKGNISQNSFSSIADAKTWWTQQNSQGGTSSVFNHSENNTFKYRGVLRPILSELKTRKSSDISWGISRASGNARIMPVFENDSTASPPLIRYIVIYEKINNTAVVGAAGVCPLQTSKSMYG